MPVAFLLAVPVGAALAWTARPALSPPSSPVTPAEADGHRSAAVPRCPPVPEVADPAPLASDVAVRAARARIAELEAARTEIAGAPRAWDPDLPDHATAEAVEARVYAAAEEAGMRVLAIDCEEMPCIAAVAGLVDLEDDDVNGALRAYDHDFRAGLDGLNVLAPGAIRPREGTTAEKVILGPIWHEPEPPDLLTDTRTTFRVRAVGLAVDGAYLQELREAALLDGR